MHIYLFVIFFVAVFLTACDREIEAHRTVAVVEKANPQSGVRVPDWLEWHHNMDAYVWLAKHEARVLPEQAADPADYETVLESLSKKYRENSRMLANRTVDMQAQLAEQDIEEPVLTLLQGLDSVPVKVEMASYGEQCRRYIQQRQQGLPHDKAIAALIGLVQTDQG